MATNSPDLSPYIDLRIYDLDPQQVFEAALQDLQSKMPGWIPREDNTEVMLMEAMALEVSESVFAINRLPSAIMVGVMKLFGVVRDEGAPPKTTININVVSTFGYTIPAGTRFLLALPGGQDPVVFSTDEAVVIADGFDSATVSATGNRFTGQANNVPAGQSVELIDNITFVDSASLASEVVEGRDPESDPEWINRGSQRLRRLVDTLAVPDHFTTAALEETLVTRATTIDLYNPSSGNLPGVDAGHVTVAVYGAGAPLTAPQKAALQAEFASRALANLTVHVIDPTITTVNVTVSVTRNSGYAIQETQDAVQLALIDYLSPEKWPWRGVVRRNELIALVANLPQVDYVASLTIPASDLALTGVAPLADVGTLVVNVA